MTVHDDLMSVINADSDEARRRLVLAYRRELGRAWHRAIDVAAEQLDPNNYSDNSVFRRSGMRLAGSLLAEYAEQMPATVPVRGRTLAAVTAEAESARLRRVVEIALNKSVPCPKCERLTVCRCFAPRTDGRVEAILAAIRPWLRPLDGEGNPR